MNCTRHAALFALLFPVMLAAAGARQAVAAEPAGLAPGKAPTFLISEFRILGSTVLPQTEVENAVYPFLGPDRTGETVKQAAAALEKAYSNRGYGAVFVDIPEQSVDSGIVRLRVTEGHLERVRISGERFFSARQIRQELPALALGAVPHLPEVQQQLLAVNSRTPDRLVTPVLKAGDEPGSVAVDLKVQDHLPLHGSLEVNNRYTADTSPTRVSASLGYDNLFQRQTSLSLQYQTAPAHPSNAEIAAVTLVLRPEHWRPTLAFYAIHTNSNVAALGTLSVIGKGTISGMRLVSPLSGSADVDQSVGIAAEYKDFVQAINITSTTGLSTPIRYLNFSVQYARVTRSESHPASLNVATTFGIRGLVNDPVAFENSRYNARPNYFYVRATGQASWALPRGFSFFGRLGGQWTGAPLISNEQYSIGGLDTARGYLESEALGDRGVGATLELRSPRLGGHAPGMLQGLYGHLFVDDVDASVIDPLPKQAASTRLWSAGAGLRLEQPFGLSLGLDLANPRVTAPRTKKGDWHADFTVRYGF